MEATFKIRRYNPDKPGKRMSSALSDIALTAIE